MSHKVLAKMYVDCGRMGAVEGLFVCEPGALEGLYGKSVYFGEILGKHSEVYFQMKKEYINVVSDDQDFISKLCSVMGQNRTIGGYNPFDYLLEEDDTENHI